MATDSDRLGPIIARHPLRSGEFIVTVFGDVAFPGGGELWIGHLIDLCAGLGISETLVRTSVSRLVAGGQLEGFRRGRRSYYALTSKARTEFEQASRVIFSAPRDHAWRFLYFPKGHAPETLSAVGMVALSGELCFGPARDAVPEGAVAFTAHADGDREDLVAMLAQVFPSDANRNDYAGFLRLAQDVAALGSLPPMTALQARLVLTHAWRKIALRVPRLPAHLLPQDHPEPATRAAFAQGYLALCPSADLHETSILSLTPAQIACRDAVHATRRSCLRASLIPVAM